MKATIQKCIKKFGYEVVRIRQRNVKSEIPVKVGNFTILMKGFSLLPTIFGQNANYSSELGRLVQVCLSKYPDLRLIDIGANYGDSVAIAKSMADISILCIEGDVIAFELLQRNLKQFNHMEALNLYLGEKTEKLKVSMEKEGWNSTIIPETARNSKTIQVHTLDELALQQTDIFAKSKILKIDAEGFDCRIIRGGLAFINAVRPAILFEYNRDNMTRIGESGIETLWLLRKAGYSRIVFFDGTSRLLGSVRLSDTELVQDLHSYADGRGRAIYHYDVCLIHEQDEELAESFVKLSREANRSEN